MPDKNSPKLGWKPEPKSSIQWLERWTRERSMWVPRRSYGMTALTVRDIRPVPPGEVHGDPDLLVTALGGKTFYVLFRTGNVFKSLDLPALVWPPELGCGHAFWVMPVGYYDKRRRRG